EAEREASEREREAVAALASARAREESLAEQVARVDREALRRAVDDAQARLEGAPAPATKVDEAALDAARAAARAAQRVLDDAKEQLDRFQGHLEQSGGAQAVEREREARAALAIARAKEREIEVEYEGWRLLRDALRDAENAEGQHLGEVLAPRVKARFSDLLEAAGGDVERYAALALDAHLRTQGLVAFGDARGTEALSVGTREQLALLLRLSIAEVLGAPLVLDDHLTHTDRARAAWFRETLRAAAHETQLLVLTCHPEVYLDAGERPAERAWVDRAAGLLRAIDATRIIES
ncbi:MAG: hypothetical protein KF901_34020, partial [Myxococcales bacterium]|nr:hypothetical protein [Myxococcales bacterium]